MRRRALLGALAAVAAGACASQALPSAQAPTAGPSAPDPLLADPPRGIWPAAYLSASEPTREAYRYAAARPDVLQWFPCFCGCVNEGHENNLDCFVRTPLTEGRVILDPHGFG